MKQELSHDFVMSRAPPLAAVLPLQQKKRDVLFDSKSLLALAIGRPSDAMGEMYKVFDEGRPVFRAPGPPFLMMSQVTDIEGCVQGEFREGGTVEIEYEVPPDAWYFEENGIPIMPFSILLEIGLQPCGWLSHYIGSALTSQKRLFFRNLDGKLHKICEVSPEAGTLLTRATMKKNVKLKDTIIQSFDFQTRDDNKTVLEMESVFGFFEERALQKQVGLPTTDEDKKILTNVSPLETIDLTRRPSEYFSTPARLAGRQLLMIDRISGFWPEGGRAHLGVLRAEKTVDPSEWFFKAHFFQDPVIPGSLGLESMLQLLQFYMLDTGMLSGMKNPRFRPIRLDQGMEYHYRGQVLPTNKKVTVVAEITERHTGVEPFVLAEAWLWVDGHRIYHAKDMGMAAIESESAVPIETRDTPYLIGLPEITQNAEKTPSLKAVRHFDVEEDTWLKDHCPTFVVPALPLTFMVGMMIEAGEALCTDQKVVGLKDIKVSRWVSFLKGPQEIRTEAYLVSQDQESRIVEVALHYFRVAGRQEMSRFEPFCTGQIELKPEYPAMPENREPLRVPQDGKKMLGKTYYDEGYIFHGPFFQILEKIQYGRRGEAFSTLRVPTLSGDLRPLALPLLLDGLNHTIRHDKLDEWSPDIRPGQVGYPHAISEVTFHGPIPDTDRILCRVVLEGFYDENPRLPQFRITALRSKDPDGPPWVSMSYVEVLLPLGRLFDHPPRPRLKFCRNLEPVPEIALSRMEGEMEGRLTMSEVKKHDWLPGTLSRIYLGTEKERAEYLSLPLGGEHEWLALRIAAKELVARRAGVHPSRVCILDIKEGSLRVIIENGPNSITKLKWFQSGPEFHVFY